MSTLTRSASASKLFQISSDSAVNRFADASVSMKSRFAVTRIFPKLNIKVPINSRRLQAG
jgi:hypothetical protein